MTTKRTHIQWRIKKKPKSERFQWSPCYKTDHITFQLSSPSTTWRLTRLSKDPGNRECGMGFLRGAFEGTRFSVRSTIFYEFHHCLCTQFQIRNTNWAFLSESSPFASRMKLFSYVTVFIIVYTECSVRWFICITLFRWVTAPATLVRPDYTPQFHNRVKPPRKTFPRWQCYVTGCGPCNLVSWRWSRPRAHHITWQLLANGGHHSSRTAVINNNSEILLSMFNGTVVKDEAAVSRFVKQVFHFSQCAQFVRKTNEFTLQYALCVLSCKQMISRLVW